jgi:hypothetical protein
VGTVTAKISQTLEQTVVPPQAQLQNVVHPPINLANSVTILDYGASGNYIDATAEKHCIDVTLTNTGPSVQVTNGENIEATKRAIVSLANELSKQARVGHIFDDLKSGSLISLGQLCDKDCATLFTKYDVKIYKNGQVIIVGERNTSNGLWNIPLAPKEPPPKQIPPSALRYSANSAINNIGTKRGLAAFLHACAFSPMPSTFLRAVQIGHFSSWPALTASLVTTHLTKLLATSKGHICMQQKNIKSAKITANLPTSPRHSISVPPRNQATAAPMPPLPPSSH